MEEAFECAKHGTVGMFQLGELRGRKGRPGGKDKKKAKIEHLNDDLKGNRKVYLPEGRVYKRIFFSFFEPEHQD